MNKWHNPHRIGGLAAVLQALAYVLFLVLVLGILPATGGYALSDYTDPATMLRKAALHPGVEPFLFTLDMLSIAFSLLPVFMMVALVQRVNQATASERRLTLGFVLINAALWLAAAAIDSSGQPMFLHLYTSGQAAEAITGYRIIGLINLELGNAASFAYGLAIVIISIGAWRTHAFSRAFLVLSGVWGLIAVLSWPFVVAGAIGTLVGIIWCLWLSTLLWHGTQPTAAVAARADMEAGS